MARMTYDERKEQILIAAMKVFSEKGFATTTIKDIALEAKMSPALLYVYYENKEALYEAVLQLTQDDSSRVLEEMKAIGPGGYSIALLTFDTLWTTLIARGKDGTERKRIFDRLFCQSMVSNPEYARAHHMSLEKDVITDFTDECFRKAEEDGDLYPTDTSSKFRLQMLMNVMLSLKVVLLTENAIYDYSMNRVELVEKTFQYCLRGAGFTPEAIAKYDDYKALEEVMKRIHGDM